VRRSTLLLIVALALAAGACNGGGDEPSATATPAGTATSTPSSETPGATEPGPTESPFEGSQDPVSGTLGNLGTPPPVAQLVDVRVGEHADFDRIVFEFSDVGTDYTVDYVNDPTYCGSGEPVELGGEAFLQITLTPAQAHDDAGQSTIGALELSPGYGAIIAAIQSCDCEGYVTWVVALPARLDFRGTGLGGPLRLAVDIGHP